MISKDYWRYNPWEFTDPDDFHLSVLRRNLIFIIQKEYHKRNHFFFRLRHKMKRNKKFRKFYEVYKKEAK